MGSMFNSEYLRPLMEDLYLFFSTTIFLGILMGPVLSALNEKD